MRYSQEARLKASLCPAPPTRKLLLLESLHWNRKTPAVAIVADHARDNHYWLPRERTRTGAYQRIRFLSRMTGGEASVRKGMERSRLGKPSLSQNEDAGPGDPAFLASTANGTPPERKHPMAPARIPTPMVTRPPWSRCTAATKSTTKWIAA